jgi:CO/xanthine dehydrogenase Mo-binding subunit
MYDTTMDVDPTKFNTFDIESDDLAGPYGAHGIGEPCVSNYSSIINAIYNATGKWVDLRGGPCLPDIVLASLGKATIATSLLSR